MLLSCAGVTLITGINSAALELYAATGATIPQNFRLKEIGLFQNTAVVSQVAIGRAQAVGLVPAGSISFDYHRSNDTITASSILAYTSWGTGPTVPTSYFRQISLPATIGAGVIWTFGEGLEIGPATSIIVWNVADSSPLDFYVTIEI